MLCFALLMTARMGIFQEQIYSRFGKHPKEALFYNVSNIFKMQILYQIQIHTFSSTQLTYIINEIALNQQFIV